MRGGRRQQAGRKKLPEYLKRIQYTLRLPFWIIQKLRKERNATQLIEDAILKKTDWKNENTISEKH